MNLTPVLRSVILAGLFAIPFIPLYVADSMFFPYITGKNFAFRVLVELIFGAWVVLALANPLYRPRPSWILWILAAFVAIIGLADLFGENPLRSFWSNFERMEGWITLIHLLMYFVVASSVLVTQKLWGYLAHTTLAVNVIMGLISISQTLAYYSGKIDDPRIFAQLGNPIYLAIYAVFHLFLTFILVTRWKGSKAMYVFYGMATVLNFAMLYWSATRGAILGFIGGILLSALLIAVFEKGRGLVRTASFGVLALVILMIGGFLAIKDTQFVADSPVLSRFADISPTSGTANARLMIWNMAWQGVKERPILGWGQENFSYVFDKYYDPYMYAQEPWFDRTHNIVFDWLIAGGFLGAIAYFLIPLFVLYYIWWRPSPLSFTERSFLTGLLAAYFFHNIFVFDNLLSYIMYITLLVYVHVRSTEDAEVVLGGERAIAMPTIQTLVLPIAIIATLFVVYAVNYHGIRTAQTLITALVAQGEGPSKNLESFKRAVAYSEGGLGQQEVREQLVQAASTYVRAQEVSGDVRQQFAVYAQEQIKKEIEDNPNSARLRIFYGSFLRMIGQYDAALAELEAARALSPKKQAILFQIGEVYLNTGQYDRALMIFKEAYELAPESNESLKIYAFAAIYGGQIDVARELIIPRFNTMAVDDDRFLRAYTARGYYDYAIEILQERIAKNPGDPQHVISLASVYYDSGNKEAAIEQIQKAIEIEPRFKAQGEQYIKDIREGRKPGQQM